MSFIKDFYFGTSFDYWQSRLDYELDRVIEEGDRVSPSAVIGAYSSYLQLAEIVFHHIYLITKIREGEESFREAIFVPNGFLKDWIKNTLDTKLIESFLEAFVFATNPKPDRHKEKLGEYLRALREAKEDFLKYHDVLNAFKHGFRLRAGQGGTLAIKGQKLLETEATIHYLTRKDGIVYENNFSFSLRRAVIKSHFLLSTIENARELIIHKDGDRIMQSHYFITDKDEWDKTFGSYHFRQQI